MYRPNFCSECGAKILRLHWHVWTSRRFCDGCSKRLLKQRLTMPLPATIALLSIGIITGRAGRPAPPPLIIERSANSPLYSSGNGTSNESSAIPANPDSTNSDPTQSSQATIDGELVYTCGARTKRGTPCARRVHSPVSLLPAQGIAGDAAAGEADRTTVKVASKTGDLTNGDSSNRCRNGRKGA